jgi:hypothetical protein
VLDPTLGLLIVVSFALLLASAAWHKARSLTDFTASLVAYRVLPESLSRRLAWLAPLLELSIAVLLLSPPGRHGGAIAAIGLLLAYAVGIAINLGRGRRDLDCGCSGPRDRRPIAAWMVWRNIVLAAALGVAALPWSPRPLGAIDAVTLVGGLTAVVLLYLALDRLLGQLAPRTAALRQPS